MDRRFRRFRCAAELFRPSLATEKSEAYTITYITYGPGDLSSQRVFCWEGGQGEVKISLCSGLVPY